MEVGDVVYTATVLASETPFVHFATRTVSAVLPKGYVVDADGHPTVVMDARELHATRAAAAAHAIDKLRGLMAKAIGVYLQKIEEVEKTHLRESSVSV
jgi:hypothetical protein